MNFVVTSQLLRSICYNMKARKTESSLQRLRQGAQRRVGASADTSDNIISDTDKICMQLFLDIQVCVQKSHDTLDIRKSCCRFNWRLSEKISPFFLGAPKLLFTTCS